jgi:hypothetical protein
MTPRPLVIAPMRLGKDAAKTGRQRRLGQSRPSLHCELLSESNVVHDFSNTTSDC